MRDLLCIADIPSARAQQPMLATHCLNVRNLHKGVRLGAGASPRRVCWREAEHPETAVLEVGVERVSAVTALVQAFRA